MSVLIIVIQHIDSIIVCYLCYTDFRITQLAVVHEVKLELSVLIDSFYTDSLSKLSKASSIAGN